MPPPVLIEAYRSTCSTVALPYADPVPGDLVGELAARVAQPR